MPDVAGWPRILILGGTTEARKLAAALTDMRRPAAASPSPELGGSSKPGGYDNFAAPSTELDPAYSVISSLAGRTTRPLAIAGDVRVGGFGGVEGLADYLRAERIDALVDATHPFAGTMTRHAVEAAARARTPLLVLQRPGWVRTAGDDWTTVRSLAEAAALLPRLGDRVFLTTGRQDIAEFAQVEGVWFLSRSVEKPTPPMPSDLETVLDRGPFTLDGERRLMAQWDINVLVTKDSGGPAPKLVAARERGIPVIVVERPAVPEAPIVSTVEAAVEWLELALPKVAER